MKLRLSLACGDEAGRTLAAARGAGNQRMTNDDRAAVVQAVARLPFRAESDGANPIPRLHFTPAGISEVNRLLASEHYLGRINACRYAFAGWVDDVMVACQVYRWPTARMLPADGSWLELSRWCLTPDAGKNAGSRMMGWAARWIRKHAPEVTTLVSYSDPVHGHTGGLYLASGWESSPTHHSIRYHKDGIGYPSGHGSWDGVRVQTPKDRWLYRLGRDRWQG